MKLRTANNQDVKNIIELVKEGLHEFGFTYAAETSESDLKDIYGEYLNSGGTFLIIEIEKLNLIATGALKKLGDGIFKIRKMYVRNGHRRKGYGKQMLEKLIQVAIAQGAEKIILETASKMKSAISLYKAYGFEEVDMIPESPRCDITLIKNV